MKMLLFFAFILALTLASPVAWSDETHFCAAGETVIFSCPSGHNMISVCATPDFGHDRGKLTYQFGGSGALPFSLIADREKAGVEEGVRVESRTLMYSGGGGAYLRFINTPYSYIAYTRIVRGGDKHLEGVAVEKDGMVIGYHECAKPATSKIGPAFFKQADIPEDKDEFIFE